MTIIARLAVAGERHLDEKSEDGKPSHTPALPTHEPIKIVDEPINEPINPEKDTVAARVFTYILEHPGKKRTDIAGALGISISTVKRALETLTPKIEYRGSKKTGGYYPK